MPRDRSKKQAKKALEQEEPAPAPASESVNESVEAPPASSETDALVDNTAEETKKKWTPKERPGAPIVDLPDVDVDKVTIGVDAQTRSLCYCCCFETGVYWDIPECFSSNADFVCLCMEIQNSCGYTEERLCMRMLTVSNCLDFTDPDGDGTCNKTLGACDMIGNACFCCKLGCGCGGDLEKTKICCHGYCQSCCFVSDVSFPPDKTPPEGRPFLPFGIGLCGKMFTGGNKEGGAVMSESSDAVKGAAAQEMAR